MKFKQLIPEYPLGSDITIIDANFHYGKRQSKSSMTIIYKDNTTGEKHFKIIYDPEYTFYMLKPEYKTPNYRIYFESIDKLYAVTCRFNDITKTIAANLDNYNRNTVETDRYNSYMKSRDFRLCREYFASNFRVFGSDMSANDFYRSRFAEQYKNTESSITRAFLDIETDNTLIPKNNPDKFPKNGNCPINAVSYLDKENMILDTFLLNQEDRNPQIRDFIDTYLTPSGQIEYEKEFKQYLLDSCGEKKYTSYNLDKLHIRMHMFDDEIKMLKTLFGYINHMRPDFLMCWNMAFDIPFIIDRINVLKKRPEDIICPKEFPEEVKFCNYEIDDRNKEFNKKNDSADITSYTVYLDQLIQFASRRGNNSKFRSYGLTNIGEEVAGVKKLDYSGISDSLVNLPYKNYKVFVMYNMKDVIVQHCIECKADDISYVFEQALLNATEYKKIHRQTVYLTNRARVLFEQFGNFILGNNYNKFKKKTDSKYEGAYVADPTKFADTNKDRINNRPIMRSSNAIDFDFTRLYPSITQEYNMAPNTAIGYITIPKPVYENENAIHNDKYTRSGQFIEDMTSDSDIEFPHRWFHLANFKEAYADIVEYFSTIEKPYFDLQNDDILPKMEYNSNNRKISPFVFLDDNTDNLINKRIDELSNETKEKIKKLMKRD